MELLKIPVMMAAFECLVSDVFMILKLVRAQIHVMPKSHANHYRSQDI